jgi:hypothetical protein
VYIFVCFEFRSGTFKKNTVAPHERKIFRNGILSISDAPTAHLVATGPVTIGKHPLSMYPFFGSLDEIRLYTRTLSDTEIFNAYSNIFNSYPINLVAHYQFTYTGQFTGMAMDSSAFGNHVTLLAGATFLHHHIHI